MLYQITNTVIMKKAILFSILSILSISSGNAQLLKKLKSKVEKSTQRALENKVDRKIDNTTEAVIDTIFETPNNIKSKKTSEGNSVDFQNIMKDIGNATYQDKYIFSVTATIEIEDLTSHIKKTTMKQGYGTGALITEMEKNGDPFIIDMKNESVIMFNIPQGTAQVMSLQWMENLMGGQPVSTTEVSDFSVKVKDTGRTKILNGYTCHEYNISFEEGRINAWYAPNVKFDYQDYLRGMAKLFSKKKEENPMQLLNTDYGYVMEMVYYNSQNLKQNTMKVTELNESVRMVNMNNFEIQKL